MSEVAGRMAVQVGAVYLERPNGGRGILLGGVPGVSPGNVCIIGGGIVGTNAAKIAVGMGAKVTLLDLNLNRLRELDLAKPPGVIEILEQRGFQTDLPSQKTKGNLHYEEYW